MTPNELLADVLLRFPVMYLAETVQQSLLSQALGMYQSLAGVVEKLAIPDSSPVETPAGYQSVAVCADTEGRWHDVTADAESETLAVVTTSKSVAPFVLHYFVNLKDLDFDEDSLPSTSITLLTEYLYTLIAIPNTQRAREAMLATGIQMELPDDNELNNRKTLLEQEMDETAAIIPMATVY